MRMTSLPPRRRTLVVGVSQIFALVFVLFAATPRLHSADNRSQEIREFTGAPTKAVWIQDAGETACVFSERPTLKLMGFDTEDGKGERALIPEIGRYWRPVITDDGTRVAFGDKDKLIVYIVNFDGTGLRPVVENALFEDFWQDPKTGAEWIYARVMEKRGDQKVDTIRRYRLDDPKINELVWDKMPIHQFMVSGDGRTASGGGDGGNSPQGLLTLPNGTFNARAGGCWPSMAPDNSNRMWVFTGNHRSIHMCIPTNRSGNAYSYTVEFNKSPGLELTGRQELYHPRWSNNIRYLAATAPLSEWSYKAEAKIPNHVAEKVEIYLGKFSEDLKAVERWMPITQNSRGDYWPCVWIQPSEKDRTAAAAATPEPELPGTAEPDNRGLVFVWDSGSTSNQIDDPKTGQIRQCTGQLRGEARFGLHHVMDLTGGSFAPDGTAEPLLSQCKASNQFAFEAILTPLGEPSGSEKVIFAFADDLPTGNVTLIQQNDELSLRLKTDGATTKSIPLARLAFNQPNHLILSYSAGKLSVYLNGKRALVPHSLAGGLGNWSAQPVIFGDAWKGCMNWPGTIEGVALLSREVPEAEARQRFNRQHESRADRKGVEPLVVEAKLVGTCAAADPQGIAPYRRCLSVQRYEVTKVLQGKLDEKDITIAQWSVLDGKVFPGYGKFAEGQTYKLTIEPWDAHPEQESERMISGDFDPSLSLFYDVTPSTPVAIDAKAVEWRGFKNNPNAGGDWNATTPEVPWSTGAAPGANDTAVLGSVSVGNREIVTTSPLTIRELDFEQLNPQMGNRLKPGASVTISNNETPIKFSGTPELDLNGQNLTFIADSLKEVGLQGTIRLGGNGEVTAVTVTNGGNDYLSAPKVEFTGNGRDAAGEALMAVDSLQLTSLGSGYTENPTVILTEPDIAGGRLAKVRAIVDKKSGSLEQLLITDRGSGYQRPPTVTISGGNGDGAQAEARLAVAEVRITRGGTGYTHPPKLTFTGGDGQDAEALAALQLTTLRYRSDQGHAFLTNTGKIDQDGAALVFDWTAENNNTGNRSWRNQGEWDLRNGAIIDFKSSTGRDSWFGSGVLNAGTMRVTSGSRLGFSKLENQGTLELGADVRLGQMIWVKSDITLLNSGEGVIRILGSSAEQPTVLSYLSSEINRKRLVQNGNPTATDTAQFTIGDGKDHSVFRVQGGEAFFDNAAGCTTTLQPGAMLALITNDAGSRHRFETRNAKFNNAGEMKLGGKLQAQGNHAGFVGIENYGTLTLNGTAAVFERLSSSTGPGAGYRIDMNPSQIANRAGGIIQGSGKLTHVNLTESPDVAALQIGNAGKIAPGVGKTPGQLAFENADVVMSGELQIDLAGPATDAAKSDAVILTGEDGSGRWKFVTDKPSVLNVVPAAGFVPKGKYRIVTAKAVEGTFTTLQYQGQAQVPYTVNYLPDGIEVVFK